jgi:thimet oligopeptidase
MYQVHDLATKQLLGHFYLDLYPRPDKFNHAACFTLSKRHRALDNSIKLGAAAIVSNLSPPSKDKDEPATLTHDDVLTFFHEFGHVMHNLCNEANYTMFSGATVEQDFVEMPS